MWTEAHRARHGAGLKQMVSTGAVEEMARRLEQADPQRNAGFAGGQRNCLPSAGWRTLARLARRLSRVWLARGEIKNRR
jgi:hypothetical protein